MAERESVQYPVTGFRFSVKIAEAEAGKNVYDVSFQEISGISTEIPVEEIQEGGENRFAHRLPQPLKYANLVLKRGVVDERSDLVNWCKNTISSGFANQIALKNITVSLKDEEDNTVLSWTFINAYPVKWEYTPLDAGKNEVFIQTIELCFQMFEEASG